MYPCNLAQRQKADNRNAQGTGNDFPGFEVSFGLVGHLPSGCGVLVNSWYEPSEHRSISLPVELLIMWLVAQDRVSSPRVAGFVGDSQL
jgi:hypothetical protein